MDYCDRLAAALADTQHGVFARWQLVAYGVSDHLIRSRTESGRWEVLLTGVYRIPGSGSSFLQELSAARLAAGPRAVVGGQGAAALYELRAIPPALEVLVPYSVAWAIPGVSVRRSRRLPAEDMCVHDGIPATTIPRTVMDLCGRFSPQRMEVVIDDLLPAGRVTWSGLHGQLERRARPGVKGTVMLRTLLEERRSEDRPVNRFERKMVRVLVAHGQPAPVTQFEVRRECGRSFFLDGAYPDELVGMECLSHRWHASLSAQRRDTERAAELREMGWEIVPIYWGELEEQPAEVAARVAATRESRRSVHMADV